MSKKRRITAKTLYQFQLVSQPQISPDGEHVVFCVQRVDKKTEKKYSNLWIVPTGGGKPRQFTYGDQVDTNPQWSPDGSQIAFLSNRKDEKQFQIYLIAFERGEACPLTSLKGSFAAIQWSPDGKRLLSQFRKKDAAVLKREKDEQKKKLGVVARHITRTFFKLDGDGYLPQERWQVWVINAKNGKAKQLTTAKAYDHLLPYWLPDSKHIAYVSNIKPEPDLEHEADDIFVISTKKAKARKIKTPYGSKYQLSVSPDGQWIAYIAHKGKGNWWQNARVWIVPTDGSAKASNLTKDFDIDVADCTVNDIGTAAEMPPGWSADSQTVYFQVHQQGNTVLKSVSIKGDNLQDVIPGDGVVGNFSFNRDHNLLAYFYGEMTNTGQLWLTDMTTAKRKKLTKFNEALLKKVDLGHVEMTWIKGPDDNDVQGWILKPPGFDKNKSYPSILQVHGGPLCQYGNYFMHEFYYLAASGYVVTFCNPRGGQGYGENHAKAIFNAWGTADYADVMAWTDFVAKQPYIDADRMGIAGGSYGGFMVNWVIGHTTHFKAAVTQRTVSNHISGWGSSDFNWSFQRSVGGDLPPWENLDGYWEQSPMKYIGNAKTPTLVIHSEQDHRCPQEQGEQIYVALKTLGVDTELVLFPDEPHGLSRNGRTDRRVERLKHIKRWFDKYLK